jgi:hypothetical protein
MLSRQFTWNAGEIAEIGVPGCVEKKIGFYSLQALLG